MFFSFPDLQDKFPGVRIYRDNEDMAWWTMVDVCNMLEISNSRAAISRLDDDEKLTINQDTNQVYNSSAVAKGNALTLINFAGLINLIMNSRKPKAKPLQNWICHEVLPTISKKYSEKGLFVEWLEQTGRSLPKRPNAKEIRRQHIQQLKKEQDEAMKDATEAELRTFKLAKKTGRHL